MKIEKTSGEDYERMFDEIAKEQPQVETVTDAVIGKFTGTKVAAKQMIGKH